MNLKINELKYQNFIPLLFISFLTIFAWPDYQHKLGSNGVFALLCTYFPLLSLRLVTPNNVKAPLIQLIIIILSYLTFHLGLEGADWNKHHWQFLHAMALSLSLFLNFAFYKRSADKVSVFIKQIFTPLFPAMFLSFFMFWYIRSTNGLEINFEVLWFFITLIFFLITFFQTFSKQSVTSISSDDLVKKVFFYFTSFLFVTTLVWTIRSQINIEAGQSRLLWGTSLFLIFASITNGFDDHYRNSLWGKVASTMYLALASVQLILAVVELSQFGPIESRYYHFFIATATMISFIPNFLKISAPFPIRLNVLSLVLIMTMMGPLNITKLSLEGQKQRLWKVFEKHKMIKDDKVLPAQQEISNEDRIIISSIIHYIYHNHDIIALKEWFQFDIKQLFQDATPFVLTADFDRDLTNLKALMQRLNLDYTTKRNHSRPGKPVKRISFHLMRLQDSSKSLDIAGYNKVIKDYKRPLSFDLDIKGSKVGFHYDNKDHILATAIDGKIVNKTNLGQKYAPYMAIDEKQRHLSIDLQPEQMDIQFNTSLFNVKFLINRIQGHIENKNIHINHIDALILINY